ncbi:MAG: hypothetical protein EOP21_01845, partial [Hyphomicrobiales bacterium]
MENNVINSEFQNIRREFLPLFMPALWWTDWDARGAWADQIPFIFFVSSSAKPRLTVVIGKGTTPAFLAACQATHRLERGGRVVGILPAAESFPPPDIADLLTSRYSACSRLLSGDLEDLEGAAGPGEVGCLILGADILRQIDATSMAMLRSRLAADAVVLSMGFAEGTAAASCRSLMDEGVSFSFMHGDGLQVTVGTGDPDAVLPRLLDQAGSDPGLGFAISQLFYRLGQGLRSHQRSAGRSGRAFRKAHAEHHGICRQARPEHCHRGRI